MINFEAQTTVAHKQFCDWLNSLQNQYVSGFWDNVVIYLLGNTYDVKLGVYINELYSANGTTYEGFIVSVPMQPKNNLLYFNKNGECVGFSDEIGTLLEIDNLGVLTQFFTNNDITLSGSEENLTISLTLETLYGNSFPVLKLIDAGNVVKSKGLVNVPYEDASYGNYAVIIKPSLESPKFLVTNKTKKEIIMSIAIFSNLTIEYIIAAKGSVQVPATAFSEMTLRTAESLGSIKYKKI